MSISSVKHRARVMAQQSVMRVMMALGSHGLIRAKLMSGAVKPGSIPVVMCLWNRPNRLEKILAMLSEQSLDQPLRLILWNNQRRNAHLYKAVLDGYEANGALASVELVASPANVGGIGRFYALARLRRSKVSGPIVLLDDDQDISPSFTKDLLSRYTPESVHGVWAFRQTESYWHRVEALDGEDATYVGTGGCILSSTIVDDRRFFSAFPRKYLFLEDIWLNFVAVQHGWRLAKLETPYDFVQEDVGQHLELASLKAEFFAYLHSDESLAKWAAAAR